MKRKAKLAWLKQSRRSAAGGREKTVYILYGSQPCLSKMLHCVVLVELNCSLKNIGENLSAACRDLYSDHKYRLLNPSDLGCASKNATVLKTTTETDTVALPPDIQVDFCPITQNRTFSMSCLLFIH